MPSDGSVFNAAYTLFRTGRSSGAPGGKGATMHGHASEGITMAKVRARFLRPLLLLLLFFLLLLLLLRRVFTTTTTALSAPLSPLFPPPLALRTALPSSSSILAFRDDRPVPRRALGAAQHRRERGRRARALRGARRGQRRHHVGARVREAPDAARLHGRVAVGPLPHVRLGAERGRDGARGRAAVRGEAPRDARPAHGGRRPARPRDARPAQVAARVGRGTRRARPGPRG